MNKQKMTKLSLIVCLPAFVATNFFLWKWDAASFLSPPASTTEGSSLSEKDGLPSVSVDDWELVLVNRDHLFESEPKSLATVGNIRVDSRIARATQDFLAAAQVIVLDEVLLSGYRSRAEQEQLYNERVAELEASGFDQVEAEATVRSQVQIPGASEHQTGLAVDMSEEAGQLDEVAGKIRELAPKYGFVLRYPEGKSHITGLDFESWHFRYVGVENAQYMEKHDLVLEEYLALLKDRK
ncbi:M15 family metallopeptidase [Streptococcus cuniculi]|nr:M15 family metallopeptidase [Streptococcus cuniculi]